MGYASKTTGRVPKVRKSADTRMLKDHYLLGTHVTIRQNVERTVEEYRGLSLSDAEDLCVASETSVLGTTTRQYLGSVEVVVAGIGIGSIYVASCWGTRVIAQMEKMSDTNLYRVVLTTEVLTLSIPQGTVYYR